MKNNINKRFVFFLFLQMFMGILPLAQAAKLAIVIDDIGYSVREDQRVYQLPKEISVAIIPSAPYAKARAENAFAQKRDILIHLPMQPQNAQQAIEKPALLVGDDFAKAQSLLENARQRVPYAIGLNNHMGSGVTADKATMRHFMQALAEQKLFFLDSKTGPSVATKVAAEFGISALERHVFLDDSNEYHDVLHQFQQAKDYARKHGVAILIGHPRKNSIDVLEKELKTLPADIQLVSMGSLWRHEKVEPSKPLIVIFDMEPAPTSVQPFEHVSPLLRGIPKE
ncbi:divergent polysaccharide deacetylase family protein [Actinobacillus minor]|uniref:divergent polysaccharide deacetylase family protein n=1 Tax=Actinobacillus minor TaxID=51047 RepID=UPI0026F013F5|nr:divergent polysaccharide deacetylase family protein [Actinobacillus minor]